MPELPDLSSRHLYLALILAIVLERLIELAITQRNTRRLLAKGGRETGAGHYPAMVALHTAFLVACPLEVFALQRPFRPWLGAAMGLLLVLAMALRYWAIHALDGRWSTRVIVLPEVPPVTGGPYRYLRHPNYLAVVVEIAALPLLHGAWITALAFSLGNAWMLAVRIASEEAALEGASRYREAFASHRRLLPVRHDRG